MTAGKRLLALLLCVVMCLSMLPAPAMAENGEPAAETTEEQQAAAEPAEQEFLPEEAEEEPEALPETFEEEVPVEEPAEEMSEELPAEEPLEEASAEEPLPAEQPPAEEPVEEIPEEPAEEPTPEEAAPAEEEPAPAEEPAEEPEQQQEEIPEEAQPSEEEPLPAEETTTEPEDETPEEEDAEVPAEEAETVQPVTVRFQMTPETASVRVYTKDEQGAEETVPEELYGSYLLFPGIYYYVVSAEGYVPTAETELTVEESETPVTIAVALEKEPAETVTVRFVFEEGVEAELRLYSVDAQGKETETDAQEDGSYLLPLGTYYYDVTANGFEAVKKAELVLDKPSEQPVEVPVALTPGEFVPNFDALLESWNSYIPEEDETDSVDNNALMEGFAAEALYGDSVPDGMGPALARKNLGASLSGNNGRMYRTFKSFFAKVANANQSSSVCRVPLSTILGKNTATYAELNSSSTFDFDFGRVLSLVRADSPYEQYWYDRQSRIPAYSEGSIPSSGSQYDITKYYFVYVFPVTREHASGATTQGVYSAVSSASISAVRNAVSRAKSIVSQASGYDDVEKLRYYAEQICALNSYNYDALNDLNNGNVTAESPWQIIYVFDGNPSTNVVCEGYSKSFQYLCDLTSFRRNIACYCLQGPWYGPYNSGGHMWNAVTMDNGVNYLVDVTHSDDGYTDRYNGCVFLLTADSGNPTDGYYITRKDGVQVFYGYDSSTYASTTQEARTITIGRAYLPSPVLGKVSNTDSGVKITWSAVSGATRYRVMRKTGSGSWAKIGETSSTSYTDTTAKARTKYSYTVVAVSSSGTSGYDKTGLSITCYYTAPKLSGATSVSGGVKITWAAGKGASKYRVFRKGPNENSWTKLGDTSGRSWTDKKVSSGKKYSYTVRSLDSSGNSVSGNASAKSVTYIAAPKLSGLGNVNGGVQIRWSKVTGAAKYRVFRKASNESSWTRLGDTTAVKYTDKTAKSGTKYSYAVRCVNSSGSRYISALSGAKAITYIAAPVLSSVQNTRNGVKITWKKSTGAVKYRVFRKTGNGSWTTLKDTTALTITDTSVRKGTKYSYTVRCISKNGSSYTSGYNTTGKSITYTPQTIAAPKITAQPKAASVMAGASVKFTVAASGSGLQYQWQYRKGSGGSWSNSQASGYNRATVTVSSTANMNNYQYRCRVSNGGGTVYSKTVTLKVYTESGWVLPSQVPANATITKTSYSYRESTESSYPTMSGWTPNGVVWHRSGSGSSYYAYFPSGYNTSDRYYNNYMHSPYSSFTTDTLKREVYNYQDGYIYWHWMYNVRYASTTTRAISSVKGTHGGGNFWYGYFYAMASTTDCPYLDNYYCCSQNLPSYNAKSVIDSFASSSDKSSSTSGLGTNRFFRFERYVSVYTDYTAGYSFYRDLEYQPNDPGDGPNISNKVMYVKYRVG